jgi:hypothetical protein
LAIAAEVEQCIGLAGPQRAPEAILGWFQSSKLARGGQETQHMTARDTFHVVEKNETATTFTMECFHVLNN